MHEIGTHAGLFRPKLWGIFERQTLWDEPRFELDGCHLPVAMDVLAATSEKKGRDDRRAEKQNKREHLKGPHFYRLWFSEEQGKADHLDTYWFCPMEILTVMNVANVNKSKLHCYFYIVGVCWFMCVCVGCAVLPEACVWSLAMGTFCEPGELWRGSAENPTTAGKFTAGEREEFSFVSRLAQRALPHSRTGFGSKGL